MQTDRRENINEQRSRAVSKLKTVRDSGNFRNNSPANFAFTPMKNRWCKKHFFSAKIETQRVGKFIMCLFKAFSGTLFDKHH